MTASAPDLVPLLRQLAALPNVPFLPQITREPLLHLLRTVPQLDVAVDAYAVYARLSRGRPRRRLMLVTHLDHPGLLLRDARSAILFGSVGYERIAARLKTAPLPIRIYPEGAEPCRALVTGYNLSQSRPLVRIAADGGALPANTPAVWDVPEFSQDNGVIRMINADNSAVTAVAVQLLQQLAGADDCAIEVIFTFLEEVHQISSTGIARRARTPFGPIDRSTLLVNLEAPEMALSAVEAQACRQLQLPAPDYDAGPLIRVSEGALRYGLAFPQTVNDAEQLAVQTARRLGIPHQYTLSGGSSDAKSFALFGLTPHVVTIAVPCRWKHNHGPDGEFIPEQVHRRDLDHLLRLLLTMAVQPSPQPGDDQLLSRRLEAMQFGLSSAEAAALRRQRVSILTGAELRLRRGRYVAQSPLEHVQFQLWRAAAHVLR